MSIQAITSLDEALLVELVASLQSMVDRESKKDGAVKACFPPDVPRELLRKVGYMENFPNLCGSIQSFTGGDKEQLAVVDTVKKVAIGRLI